MKCLLCSYESNDLTNSKKDYLDFHTVDKDNQLFIKHFNQQSNVFYGKKCITCNEFLASSQSKIVHDFLTHCDAGKDVFEEKLNYTVLGELWKFEITFERHSYNYDFYNAEKLVDEFLSNAGNRVLRSEVDFFIKCGFSLEIIQPSTVDSSDAPIKKSRYCFTDAYETKSFNDFIYLSLREPILKRVMNNGLTGISWYFNHFLYINVKILNAGGEQVR